MQVLIKPRNESDIDQLSWTVRLSEIGILQCHYLDVYREKCFKSGGLASLGTGPV